jgi:hypothetical protein
MQNIIGHEIRLLLFNSALQDLIVIGIIFDATKVW